MTLPLLVSATVFVVKKPEPGGRSRLRLLEPREKGKAIHREHDSLLIFVRFPAIFLSHLICIRATGPSQKKGPQK